MPSLTVTQYNCCSYCSCTCSSSTLTASTSAVVALAPRSFSFIHKFFVSSKFTNVSAPLLNSTRSGRPRKQFVFHHWQSKFGADAERKQFHFTLKPIEVASICVFPANFKTGCQAMPFSLLLSVLPVEILPYNLIDLAELHFI